MKRLRITFLKRDQLQRPLILRNKDKISVDFGGEEVE